jgi:uncharacterized protein (UPF0218 family)
MATVTYRLPDALRPALQTPVGELVPTGELGERLAGLLEGGDPIIAVGDVTSLTLLEMGYEPKLIMVDFMSERTVMEADDPRRGRLGSYGDHSLSVVNPAATITAEMEEAIGRALEGEGTWRIEVEGEEDLAVLPCMVKAGGNARILYGMPGEGMVVVDNDTRMKTWAQAFLARMTPG